MLLEGHLTATMLAAALLAAEQRVDRLTGPIDVVFDCLRMTGYDMEAREAFVDWHRRMGTRLGRIAIITERRLWHLIISGMGLASQQHMKAFHTFADALPWLAEQS